MGLEITGLGALVVLALDIWAIISVVGSAAGAFKKVVWVLVILVFPLIGFILWLLFGPRQAGPVA